MTQTTTHVSACNAVIEVDDDGGTPVNISGSSNRASIDFSKEVGEGVTFDGNYKIRTNCKRDASMSIRAFWTKASNEARDLLEAWFDADDNSRTISIYPAGKVIGNRYYSGEWLLTTCNIQIDAGESGPMTMELEAVCNGAVGFLNVAS